MKPNITSIFAKKGVSPPPVIKLDECDTDAMLRLLMESDWDQLDGKLRSHWSKNCPLIFAPKEDLMDLSIDEASFASHLLDPLMMLMSGERHPESPRGLERIRDFECLIVESGINVHARKPGQICGRVFKSGELTYSCRDCANDPTCVMCYECFSHSDHGKHKYKMHASGGSGYCDCGDPEAWKCDPYCKLHKPIDSSEQDIISEDSEKSKDSLTSGEIERLIPPPMELRLKGLFSILLRYSIELTCWSEYGILPPGLLSLQGLPAPFQTILFNDEHHTYDQVIKALKRAIKCSEDNAMLLATVVDREGRSIVRNGAKDDCDKVKKEIEEQTKDQQRGPLRVEVTEASLAAHQLFALRLISWMTNAAQEFPPLVGIIGELLLKEKVAIHPEADAESLVTQIMTCDISLWKSARTTCHELMMGTILMDFEMKKEFAKLFTKKYSELMKQFVKDDHEHSLSIVALTVQIYTVPTVARMLIAEVNALAMILEPLLTHLQPFYDRGLGYYSFISNSYPIAIRRSMFILNDLKYLLNSPPTPAEWSQELREGFRVGWDMILQLLSNIQGMDAQKRQTGNHMEWESEWETAFNMQLRLQTVITMFQAWVLSDVDIFKTFFRSCLAMEEDKYSGYQTEIVKVGEHSALCVKYDPSKESVSIHIPVTRMLGGIFLGLGKFDVTIEEMEAVSLVPERMIELPLRVMVMGAQIHSNMWRRNGYSVLNQVHNYMSPLCRTEMFDKDILMLQVGAALMDPNAFLIQVLHKFGLSNWVRDEYEAEVPAEELSKQVSALLESFFQLIIYVAGERWIVGLSEGMTYEAMIRREVIHILCRGPLTFSKIEKQIPDYPFFENIHLEEVIRTVATFKQPTGGSAGVFELKPEFRNEYNSYFYHFSRTEMSQAEQYLREKDKNFSPIPPETPAFLRAFRRIPGILASDVFFNIVTIALERCAAKSRFASDGHLHRILFLIGMALNEEKVAEKVKNHSESLAKFSLKCQRWKRDQNRKSVLELLEGLVGKQEAGSSGTLLNVVLKQLREAIAKHLTGEDRLAHAAAAEESRLEAEGAEDEEERREKKRVQAEQRRKKAMAQMSKLQKKFITQNKNMFEDSGATDEGDSGDEESYKLLEGSGFPVCIGPNRSELDPKFTKRKVTCILCQETEEIGFGERGIVFAAYIQQSTLFSKAEKRTIDKPESYDPLFMPETLFLGVHASTCGHTMHAECWQTFFNSVQAKESRRSNRWPRLSSFDVNQGQYLCPLCKRISNTAMPVLPPLSSLQLESHQPQESGSQAGSSSLGSTERPEPHQMSYGDWTSTLKEMVTAHALKMRSSRIGGLTSRKRSRSAASDQGATATAAADGAVASGSRKSPQRRNRNLSLSMPTSSGGVEGHVVATPPPPPPPPPPAISASGSPPVFGLPFPNHDDDSDDDDSLNIGEFSDPEADEDDLAALGAAVYPLQQQPQYLFQRGALAMMEQFQRLFRRMSSTNEKVPIGKANLDMVKTFAQAVYRVGLGVNPDDENGRIPIMSWQAAAYSIRCLAGVLTLEQKPLFGAFSSRQQDCLHSLTRYTACAQFASRPEVLRKHCLRLMSPFLLEGEKLSNFPSIFQLDIFTSLVEATMSLGSLYLEEPGKWAVPTGGLSEFYLLKLMLSAYVAQLLFSMPLNPRTSDTVTAESSNNLKIILRKGFASLWISVSDDTIDFAACERQLKHGLTAFLQCCALLFHSLTQIPPPEGLKDPSIEQFPLLCRYMGLPEQPDKLIEYSYDEKAWKRWMSVERVAKLREKGQVTQIPVGINRLIKLPHGFGDLIHSAANFNCPSLIRDDSRTPALCLICGDLVCSQSYCCQRTLGKEQVGACNYHAHTCTAGVGIFLRMRDSQIVLLTKGKGWFMPAPYVDEFGETDSGFRRGNPLFFNEELYRRIEKIWLHQSIEEEVSNHLEMDIRVLAMDWVHL